MPGLDSPNCEGGPPACSRPHPWDPHRCPVLSRSTPVSPAASRPHPRLSRPLPLRRLNPARPHLAPATVRGPVVASEAQPLPGSALVLGAKPVRPWAAILAPRLVHPWEAVLVPHLVPRLVEVLVPHLVPRLAATWPPRALPLPSPLQRQCLTTLRPWAPRRHPAPASLPPVLHRSPKPVAGPRLNPAPPRHPPHHPTRTPIPGKPPRRPCRLPLPHHRPRSSLCRPRNTFPRPLACNSRLRRDLLSHRSPEPSHSHRRLLPLSSPPRPPVRKTATPGWPKPPAALRPPSRPLPQPSGPDLRSVAPRRMQRPAPPVSPAQVLSHPLVLCYLLVLNQWRPRRLPWLLPYPSSSNPPPLLRRTQDWEHLRTRR